MPPQTLNGLADDADSDNPTTVLFAIAELRRELDRREAVAVRRARLNGLTWAHIATALGVSRQAVHKKHGKS